jgi:uncharacterized protein YuzE
MRISYDPQVDALTIRLVEGPVQCQVIHLTDQVAVDLGADERLVALEILDASELLPGVRTEGVELENLPVFGTTFHVSRRRRASVAV